MLVCLRNPRLSSAARKLIKSGEPGMKRRGRVEEDGARERERIGFFLPYCLLDLGWSNSLGIV